MIHAIKRGSLVLGLISQLWTASLVTAQVRPDLVAEKLQRSVEDEIAPAYQDGDSRRTLELLCELTKKLAEDQRQVLDGILASAGMPTTGELMVQSRLTLVRQGQGAGLPKPHLREALLAIPLLRDEARNALDDAKQHAVMQASLPHPGGLDEYERLFWEIHVLENRLRSACDLCDYGAAFVQRGGLRARARQLSDAELDLLDTNFANTAQELRQVAQQLTERKLELRVRRLEYAVDVLRTSNHFLDRLQAAFAVDLDGALLAEFFAKPGVADALDNPALADPELPDRIAQLTAAGRSTAGKMTAQSHLFFEGLHWWLRGRFGRGPDGGGLLKSPLAARDERAAFGLEMPQRFPAPRRGADATLANDASTSYDQDYPSPDDGIRPDYERRHHYVWTYEYRKLLKSYDEHSQSKTTARDDQVTQRVKLSTFY